MAVETEEEEREVVPEAGGPHSARGMQDGMTQAVKGGLGGTTGDKGPNAGPMDKEILEAGSRVRPGNDRGIAKTKIGGKAPLARIRARLMKAGGNLTNGAVAESRRTTTGGWQSSRGAQSPPWRCRALMRSRSAR